MVFLFLVGFLRGGVQGEQGSLENPTDSQGRLGNLSAITIPPPQELKNPIIIPKVKINWKKTFQPKTRSPQRGRFSRFDLDHLAVFVCCFWQGSNGDKACDYYHRWKDDIARISEYGFNTYRCLGWNFFFEQVILKGPWLLFREYRGLYYTKLNGDYNKPL